MQSRYVDAIFTRMLVRYGSAWVSKWQDVPTDALKADWSDQLDGLSGAAIRYALDNLPDFPPTAPEFKRLCCNRPPEAFQQLPAPKADPERVAAELSKLAALKAKVGRHDWAYRLQEREKAGEPLSSAQRQAWRTAMLEVPESVVMGEFNPIPADKLPPGMREAA